MQSSLRFLRTALLSAFRITKDRPGLSSERAPTETGQQIPDPKSWKGSNIWSNVHEVGSKPRHTDLLTLSRKVTLTDSWVQMTDPTSRQRGRPTETGQQIPDPKSWKGSNIHEVGSTARHTDLLSAVKWLWLWLLSTNDRPDLLSERAPQRDSTTNSRPKVLKRKQYLVKRPQSGLDTETYWLTDSQP
jgi:hypothetical protein